MTTDRPVSASPEEDHVRISIENRSLQLDPETAEAFKDELDQALKQVGPNKIQNILWFRDGIGRKTAELVAEEFRTLENLREASDKEIEEVPQVGPAARCKIQDAVLDSES